MKAFWQGYCIHGQSFALETCHASHKERNFFFEWSPMCAGLFCNTAAHLIDNELSVLFCDSVSTKSRSLSELHVLWALCQTRTNFFDQLVWCFVGFSQKRPHLLPRFSCQQQSIQKYTKTRTHRHTHYIHTNIYTFNVCTHMHLSIYTFIHTVFMHAYIRTHANIFILRLQVKYHL